MTETNPYWVWEKDQNAVLIYAVDMFDANCIFRGKFSVPKEAIVYVQDGEMQSAWELSHGTTRSYS